MSNYAIVEIKVWKLEYGIIISLVTLFIGLILAALHVIYVFFCTPKNYLLHPTAAKKQTIIAECRPPPTVSQPVQRKRRNRPSQLQQQPKRQNGSQFFYIDTTTTAATNGQKQLPSNPSNFDEEFLDRLKQDIRYYPKPATKNAELRKTGFVPHIHGRITSCSRKKVHFGSEIERNSKADIDENIDSFLSDASEDSTANIGAENGTTKTTEGGGIPDTEFTRFAAKYLNPKEMEEDFQQRDTVADISIKENDTIYKTLKNVKHGF